MATKSDETAAIDDGGPAFPQPGEQYEKGGDLVARSWDGPGMTLRDYFAAKVMHAEVVTAGAVEEAAIALNEAADAAGQSIEQRIAFLSYQMADAMLVERQRTAKPKQQSEA